eukprot:3201534-Amphidinium_carterae.1
MMRVTELIQLSSIRKQSIKSEFKHTTGHNDDTTGELEVASTSTRTATKVTTSVLLWETFPLDRCAFSSLRAPFALTAQNN